MLVARADENFSVRNRRRGLDRIAGFHFPA
jgi:hypothetical protein